ncbi:MAG: DUF3892 domain-containing protein [Oscillospiraceae bacterium]|nr:DUF3892 domain-containing protein [Oscillospiraceae bacterium]MBQ9046168.1 DUF3892 domain-containing protein [Oscillospiraceae bacterium]
MSYFATSIKMKPYSFHSNDLLEIDQIYISGCPNPGFYKKAAVYDHLRKHPGTIKVNIYPYPNLVTALSPNYEKYVRSTPNGTTRDNLLSLPRV